MPTPRPTDVLRLKSRSRSLLALFFVCACFVVMGGYAVSEGKTLGWLAVAFFGFGCFIALVSLLPGSSYLELRPDGMQMCTLYRKWLVRWRDVETFFPVLSNGQKTVGWLYNEQYRVQAIINKISMRLTGADAGLPDTYGMTAEALADLLNEWRLRYGVSEEESAAANSTDTTTGSDDYQTINIPADGTAVWAGMGNYILVSPDGQHQLKLTYIAEPPHGDSYGSLVIDDVKLPGFAWGSLFASSTDSHYVVFDWMARRFVRQTIVVDLKQRCYFVLPEPIHNFFVAWPVIEGRGKWESFSYRFNGEEIWTSYDAAESNEP